jgi:hypothetical protein
MENSSKTFEKLSAYTKIAQTFAESCQQNNLEPLDAWLAIGRFFGWSAGIIPANLSQGVTVGSGGSQVPVQGKIALTQKQAEEARRLARNEKAARLKLKPQEVNLTTPEAKQAKAAYREALLKGTPLNKVEFLKNDSSTKPLSSAAPSGNSQKESKKEKVPAKQELSPTQKAADGKKEVGVQLDKTGSRATAKTKLDNLRRTTLRGLPSAIEDLRLLHLVAYVNHYNRLARQWEEYQKTYQSSGMLSPIRGLPAVNTLDERLQSLIQEGVKGLRMQNDSPGTYILQAENGASFWERDIPSKDCPAILQKPLSEEDKVLFDKACKLCQEESY